MSERKSRRRRRSFTVREMEIDDLAAVYQLGLQVFTADRWPSLYRNWDEYEVTNLFNTDGEYCLVAENDDEGENEPRIVGFVLGTVIFKPRSAWAYGYVVWLCAHPRWRRRGVARRLVDKVVELMVEQDGIRILMADTDPDNTRAVGFFADLGLQDARPHVYLSSNLESNPRYAHLVQASRAAEERPKKKARPAAASPASTSKPAGSRRGPRSDPRLRSSSGERPTPARGRGKGGSRGSS